MNKDSDERLVQKGEFRDALNVKVVSSSGSDVGAVENSISNTLLTQLNFGSNPVCIGSVADDANNDIYHNCNLILIKQLEKLDKYFSLQCTFYFCYPSKFVCF